MGADWQAGAVFAIVWLVVWLPLFMLSMLAFWRRKDVQPIKARSPKLVMLTDAILLLYTISLCFQRIVEDNYPCALNVWSGYAGTIVLFNSYLWRCWTLYFNFNLTHVRLQQSVAKSSSPAPSTRSLANGPSSSDAASSSSAAKDHSENFFIVNRHLTSTSFLFKVNVAVFVVLMVAPVILTATHPAIKTEYGDGCSQAWGPVVLAAYVAAYVLIFSWFSFSLRSVVDGFRIKSELKFTGFIALVAVIPWYVFNNLAKDINSNVFPFSTLFLLIAIVAAFGASTIYPLYMSIYTISQGGSAEKQTWRSIFNPQQQQQQQRGPASSLAEGGASGGGFDRLNNILEDAAGSECFKQFLTKEFSVENILFYNEVEAYRAAVRASRSMGEDPTLAAVKFVTAARALHAKYIAVGSAFQVNLPDPVVRNCEAHLRYEVLMSGAGPAAKGELDAPKDSAGSGRKTLFGRTSSAGVLHPPSPPHPQPQTGPPPSPSMHALPGPSSPSAAAAAASSSSSSSASAPLAASNSDSAYPSPPQSPQSSSSSPASPSAKSLSSIQLVVLADLSAPPPAQQAPLSHLDGDTPTLFDDSQRTIYQLMEKDSMLRFVRSEGYKRWIQSVAEAESRKKVLQEMNLA